MGIVKSLFKASGKIVKRNDEPLASPDYLDQYDEFESKHGKTCEKMESKIYNVNTDNIDPDKNIAAYKKMLDLARELEDFCKSHGVGGIKYYEDCYSDIYESIQSDLDCYMSENYNDDKVHYEEYKLREKAIKSLSSKIIKAIQNAGGSMMQTELKKLFQEDELCYYSATIKRLTEAGKIEKVKTGSRVSYKIL